MIDIKEWKRFSDSIDKNLMKVLIKCNSEEDVQLAHKIQTRKTIENFLEWKIGKLKL